MIFNKLALIALVGAIRASAGPLDVKGLDAWHLDNLYALAVEQLDPIVAPNAQSSHMHRILGGSNFAAAYNGKELEASSCTTAAVTVDHSAYWAPQLYWIVDPENPDTTSFMQLPSFNRFYYFLGRNDFSQPVQAWPEGFKMVAGDPNRKTVNPIYKYYCHRKPDLSDEISSDHFNFDDPCLGGIKFDLSFPSCWDGVNLYKPDNSHISYPTFNLREGPCPISHPIRLPSILLEYTYHPESYPAITKGQTMNGHLAWANGDTTGFGLHADFIMGWDRKILTEALNDPRCVTQNMSIPITECPVLNQYFNINAAKACKPARGQLAEPYAQGDGNVVPKMPGCNPLWGATGPKPTCATPPPALDISAFESTQGPDVLPVSEQYNHSLPTAKGWNNIGCYNNKAMSTPGMMFSDANLSAEKCMDTCKRNGFSYAAVTKTGTFRCLCDNKIDKTAGIALSGCDVPCPAGGTCGGEFRLDTFYQAPAFVAHDTSVTDLGCYKLPYDWKADPPVQNASYTFTSKSMTRSLCSSTCSEKGASYAATRDTSCYCNTALNLGTGYFAPSDNCARPCGGNSSEICGDVYALSIQNLKPVAMPVDSVVYRGCIADGTPRVLNATGTYSARGMTVDLCANTARQAGKRLFGLENGDQCYIGNSLLSANVSEKCTMPASGDKSTMAGGAWAMSLYELVPIGSTPSATVSPAPTATIVKTTSVMSMTVTANTTRTITSSSASNTSAVLPTPSANATSTLSGDIPMITPAPVVNASSPISTDSVASSVFANVTESSSIPISSLPVPEESPIVSATPVQSALPSITDAPVTDVIPPSTTSSSSSDTSSDVASSTSIAAPEFTAVPSDVVLPSPSSASPPSSETVSTDIASSTSMVAPGPTDVPADVDMPSATSPTSSEPASTDVANSTTIAAPVFTDVPDVAISSSTLVASSTDSVITESSSGTLAIPTSVPSTSAVLSESTDFIQPSATESAIPIVTDLPTLNSTTSSLAVSLTQVVSPVSSSGVIITSTSATSTSASALPTSIADSPALPYVYRGCVQDGSPRVLNATWTYSGSKMTPDFCYNIAKQAGKKLFGIQGGIECFVGDALLSNKTVIGCDMPCSGNKTLSCGGNYKMSMWSTQLPPVTESAPVVDEPIRAQRFVEVQRRRLGQTA